MVLTEFFHSLLYTASYGAIRHGPATQDPVLEPERGADPRAQAGGGCGTAML